MGENMKKRKNIKWKEGSGSILIGVVILLLGFTATVVILEMFNLYYTQTKTQTLTDAIADGSAIAGNLPSGFDEQEMRDVANELITKNNASSSITYIDFVVMPEIDGNGNTTGNTMVQTDLKVTEEYYFPTFINYNDRFEVSASAIVRAEAPTNANGFISVSFAQNPSLTLPFATTTEQNRLSAYVTYFIEYYLCPEYNELYQTTTGLTKGHLFIQDYMKCMGLGIQPKNNPTELEGYFNSQTNGWKKTTNISELMNFANSGKASILIAKNKSNSNDITFYVVVPQRGYLENSHIPIATVGTKNTNYEHIDYEELKTTHDIVGYIHQ